MKKQFKLFYKASGHEEIFNGSKDELIDYIAYEMEFAAPQFFESEDYLLSDLEIDSLPMIFENGVDISEKIYSLLK